MSKRRSEQTREDLFAPLETIFSKVGESIIVVDPDGKIVFANDAAVPIYREPDRASLMGKSVDELVSNFEVWDERGHKLEMDQFPTRMALDGKTRELVVRFCDKRNGATGWSLLRSGPVLGPDGEVKYAVSVARDVTREKENFGDLKLQRTLLSAAMEATIDGMLAVAQDRKVLLYNHRFVEMWEIPGEVLESRDDARLLEAVTDKLVHPDEFLRKVEEMYSRPDHKELEEVKLKDRRVFERYTAPLRGDDGVLHGRLWVFRDITERKEAERQSWMLAQEQVARAVAEKASREAEFLAEVTRATQTSLVAEIIAQRVAELAAKFFDGWCVIDAETVSGSIKRAAASNKGERACASDLLELAPDLATFRKDLEEIPDEGVTGEDGELPDWARDEKARRALRELGMEEFVTLPIATPRQRFALITLGSGAEGWLEPETQRLAEELARRLALGVENARLYSEARMAVRARNDFLSIASHELKTPIAALLLTSQVVLKRGEKEDPPLPTWVVDKLHLVERQCHRLNELIRRLLDVSMAISGRLDLNPEKSDLVGIVRDVLASYAVEISKSGSKVELRADRPVVGCWDRSRLEQLVQNLVSNAVKYGKGNPIGIQVFQDEDEAVLVVEDRGIGIPQEAQGRLFQRFERAVSERHIGGLGLGLYIVRQIVEGHGGNIGLLSEPDEGTQFTVRLPLAYATVEREPSAQDDAPGAQPS